MKRLLWVYITVSGLLVGLYAADILYGKWKYTFIAFNFLFALACRLLTKKNSVIVMGLFFTCLADFNLVLMEQKLIFQCLGIAFFIIVQGCYYYHIRCGLPPKEQHIEIFIRGLLCAGLAIGGVFIAKNISDGVLFALAAVYAAFSFCNIAAASFDIRRNLLLLSGLCLLLACDICICIKYFNGSALPEWHFYIPSQILITIYAAANMAANMAVNTAANAEKTR